MPSLEQLSQQLDTYFKKSDPSFVNIQFFVPSQSCFAARTVFPHFTPYSAETTMFGKVIRMAVELEKKKNLLKVLAKHGITEIMFTDAKEGAAFNKDNAVIITTKTVESVFGQLEYAKAMMGKRYTGALAEQYMNHRLKDIIDAQG